VGGEAGAALLKNATQKSRKTQTLVSLAFFCGSCVVFSRYVTDLTQTQQKFNAKGASDAKDSKRLKRLRPLHLSRRLR